MLSLTAISIFDVLCTNASATTDTLVEETEHSVLEIEETIDDLEARGQVIRQNDGTVKFAVHPVPEAYRMLNSKVGHVDWHELLTPDVIRIGWYLDTPQSFSALADPLGLSREDVRMALEPVLHRALITSTSKESEPTYIFAKNIAEPLHELLTAVVMDEHRHQARTVAPTATIEWCDPHHALVQPHTQTDTETLDNRAGWQVTGLAKFADYDLQFFLANEPTFWHGPQPLTPAHVACHNLLIDCESRRVSYSMLLLDSENVSLADATEAAQWYGLVEEIEAIYEYLSNDQTQNELLRLPSPSEYQSLKNQYKVN